MGMQFKKASRARAKGRVAIIGPSGSGKTYTMLLLLQMLGKRVAVIDSERGSASKYAGCVDKATGITFDFDVLELESHSPESYVQAIQLAEREGYDAIGVDSLSHAWMGRDGALEQVDKAAKRSQSGNSFTAWRDVTPKHNALVDALTMCQAHLIVTMRSKTEYVLEEDGRGKKTPRKIGLAPIQRDGLEYEFDVVGDMNLEHDYVISKTRCAALDGAVINKPGKTLAETLRAWLETGAEPPPKPAPVVPVQPPPCFSQQAKWVHAKEWNGRPLSEAPLDVLRAYRDLVNNASLSQKGSTLDKTMAVLARVDAAINAKVEELATQDAAEPDGNKAWGLTPPDDVGREDDEAEDPAHEHAS